MRKRMKFRFDSGFTLVELVVSMLCVSIVMIGVMTWLLVGIRVEKSAADTMERQQTARVVISLLESMTSSGKVSQVRETGAVTVNVGDDDISLEEHSGGSDWALLDDDGNVLVRYRAGSGSIVSGGGNVLMDGLESASAKFDTNANLLKLTMVADGKEYATDIFCRTKVESQSYGTAQLLDIIKQKAQTESIRFAFLTLLSSQTGSTGEIIDKYETPANPNGNYKYDYYTECYLANTAGTDGGKVNNWSLDGDGQNMNWSPKTPWCATFVSWALLHMNHECYEPDRVTLAYVPLFADVNDGQELFHEDYVLGSGFTASGGLNTADQYKDPVTGAYGGSGREGDGACVLGKDNSTQKVGKWVGSASAQSSPESVSSGDLIFFDWGTQLEDGTFSGAPDGSLDHVGVVFYIQNDQVFTIEGNSGGTVALRNYSLSDPAIVGYGLLDWAEN